MDPLTHTLCGALIPKLGFKRKGSLVVSLISSIAPDFDYVAMAWGSDVLLKYHRGVTHSLVALIVFPLVLALLLRFKLKKGFFYYFFLSFLAFGLHIFFDMVTPYGVMFFSPFDTHFYTFDLVTILDPHILLSLITVVAICLFNKKRAVFVSFVWLALLAAFLGSKYYMKTQAEDLLRSNMDEYQYRLCPLPNDFLRWWFVSKSKSRLKTGFVDLLAKRVYILDSLVYSEADPAVLVSKRTEVVKNFLGFSKFPYPEKRSEENGTVVIWKELSYGYYAGDNFKAKVFFNRKGKITDSFFTF